MCVQRRGCRESQVVLASPKQTNVSSGCCVSAYVSAASLSTRVTVDSGRGGGGEFDGARQIIALGFPDEKDEVDTVLSPLFIEIMYVFLFFFSSFVVVHWGGTFRKSHVRRSG